MSFGQDQTPPGVETVAFDQISSQDRDELENAWHEKDLRLCQVCSADNIIAHLLTCAACGNNRIKRIFYCSVECQKKDWNTHKSICGPDHEGPDGFGVPRGKSHRSELNRERETWQWLEAMRDAIVWASIQAFRHSRIDAGDKQCLNLRFESIEDRDRNVSYHLVRLFYAPLNDQAQAKLVTLSAGEDFIGYYSATLDRRLRVTGCVPTRSSIEGEDPDSPLPQYPWILSQVANHAAYDARIVRFLTRAMVQVVSRYNLQSRDTGVFDRYIAPPFTEDWMVEGYWDWRKLMRNVIRFDPNGPPKRTDDTTNPEIS